MKIVLQRVKNAAVTNDSINNQIQQGYCLLVGVGQQSTSDDIEILAKKIANARLFEDDNGKMNLSIKDIAGEILSISQFTLYADVKKGNRPGFTKSMSPDKANELFELFNDALRAYDLNVLTGEFGTDMQVGITNEGPVTIVNARQDGKII